MQTFTRSGRLGRVFVAVSDAVDFFLVALRGRSFVWSLTHHLKLHVSLKLLTANKQRCKFQDFLFALKISPKEKSLLEKSPQTWRHLRVQYVDEERVILEEVVSLETAAVSNPKFREEFVVVGCGEKIMQIKKQYPIEPQSGGVLWIRLQ